MALKLTLTFVGLFIIGYFISIAITLPPKESAAYLFYGMPGLVIIIFAWFPWSSNNNQEEEKTDK